MAAPPLCGSHHYFVCEVIGVPKEGKVHLLYLCTDCGDSHCKEFVVAAKDSEIRLLKEEKQKDK
jgi:hypothetical protein